MLVIGAGPVGLFAALAASQLGISRICVLERDSHRRATAESLGLAAFESVDDVRAYLGAPDVIFDAVGSSATRSLAVELVRRGGRVVLDGLADPMGEFSFMQAILREVEMHGSFGYAPEDFDSALAALEGDSFGISSHVKVIPFADGPAAFESMAGGDLLTLKTVLHVSES
jgi:threonine dehydrogenase-like Zn-dependent dehydrogenase